MPPPSRGTRRARPGARSPGTTTRTAPRIGARPAVRATARRHSKLDPAVVAQARAIIGKVREACKQARIEAKGGEASEAAKAACKQAREQARAQLKALIQSAKGSRKQIKNQIRAARS